MTTTAATWFHSKPENNAYALAERVRTTLWEARLGSLWLDTVKAEPPYLMQGQYDGSDIEMEWEPARWLTLRARPGIDFLAQRLSFVLRLKPVMVYETPEGWMVWEWHVDGGDKRWQSIQGIPSYQRPRRLA